jgi:hypothetical protein
VANAFCMFLSHARHFAGISMTSERAPILPPCSRVSGFDPAGTILGSIHIGWLPFPYRRRVGGNAEAERAGSSHSSLFLVSGRVGFLSPELLGYPIPPPQQVWVSPQTQLPEPLRFCESQSITSKQAPAQISHDTPDFLDSPPPAMNPVATDCLRVSFSPTTALYFAL